MGIQTGTIVKIFPTKYWVESDLFGSKHIMIQHEGMKPFCYATLNYDYAYTSNSGIHSAAVKIMKDFGIAEADIEWRLREIDMTEDISALDAIVEQCAEFIEQDQGSGVELANRLRKHFGVGEIDDEVERCPTCNAEWSGTSCGLQDCGWITRAKE